jgi:hypothetical protein
MAAIRQQFEFLLSFLRFIYFYKSLNIAEGHECQRGRGDEISIVVTPWMYTAVPWFAITVGIYLSRYVTVEYIFDNSKYDSFSLKQRFASFFQNALIEIALILCNVKYRKISKIKPISKDAINKEELSELELLAAKSRIHKFKTSLNNKERESFEQSWLLMQTDQYRLIKPCLEETRSYKVLIPGGVYGNSGLYCLALAGKNKIASYDSGLNRLLFCLNGVAGYQQDVPRVVEMVSGRLDDIGYQKIEEYVADELSLRTMGLDFYKTQVCSAGSNDLDSTYDIVIPLNITWDLPALGKHRFFIDNIQWLEETVSFILDKTKFSVCVRQHPHERHHSSGNDLARHLAENFSSNERFSFISATQEVNSYGLIKNSRVVLPYVSTIGIEAALLGKVVVIESSCYYAEQNFVNQASSKRNYFELIEMACNGKIRPPSDKARRNAIMYYYVSQYCTPLDSEFTPFLENFSSWCYRNEDVFAGEAGFMLKSLLDKVPSAFLKSEEFFNGRN